MKSVNTLFSKLSGVIKTNPRSALSWMGIILLCAGCSMWIVMLQPGSVLNGNSITGYDSTTPDTGSSGTDIDVCASIYSDGVLVEQVMLSSDFYECTITNKNGGTNTIRLEDGCIGVIDASCPNKQCIHFGMVSYSAIPIVCVPNALVITFDYIQSGTDFTPDGITY